MTATQPDMAELAVLHEIAAAAIAVVTRIAETGQPPSRTCPTTIRLGRAVGKLTGSTPDPGPAEPRWLRCSKPGCVAHLDREQPHVAETLSLEVLHGRHDLETREAHPGRVWHPACAPDTWPGAR